MKYIREGLENDLDISLYAKFNYSSAFMREFCLALKDNLPVVQLVNDKTSFNKLQIGCNILRAYKEVGLKFTQLKEIAFGLRDEVNIFIFTKPEFSGAQMHEIRLALKEDFNLLEYVTSKDSASVMKSVRESFLDGSDAKCC